MEATGGQILTLLLVICVNCLVQVNSQQLELDGACRLGNGPPGICKKFQDCPSAAQAVQSGRRPTVCYYSKQDPIVCCPTRKGRQRQQQPWATPAPSAGWRPSPRPPPGSRPVTRPPLGARPVTRPPVTYRPVTRHPPQGFTSPARPPLVIQPVTAPPRRPRPNTRPPQRVPTPALPLPLRPRPPIPRPGSLTPPKSNGQSWQKCKLYAKEVFREVRLPVLLFDPPTELKADCAVNDHIITSRGALSKPKEFPHMAALGYGDKGQVEWLCGGSLISDKFVLTAATCAFSKDRGRVRWVRFGDLNMADKDDDEKIQTAAVAKVISHPRYKAPSFYHDIALIKLRRPVKFDPSVRPACLNTNMATSPGVVAIATGWGATRWVGQPVSQDLTKFRLKFRPASQCNDTYKPLVATGKPLAQGFTQETMICAGDPENRRDSCVGYSGDPLQSVLTEPYCMYNILGVASFGPGQCREKDVPAVYTRVSHYVPWIESVVWP